MQLEAFEHELGVLTDVPALAQMVRQLDDDLRDLARRLGAELEI